MPRKSTSRKLAEVHETALQRFEKAWQHNPEVRRRAQLCRRFISIPGGQWEWDVHNYFEKRMKLEVNKVALAVTRIKNEYKNNRIASSFMPKDGTEGDALADTCAARYRADTQDTAGRQARDNAFDELVDGGMGAWRIRTDYESKAKGLQRVCLEPINDAAITVYFDPNSRMEDKSDAKWGFILTFTTREAFVAEWGVEGSSWPEGHHRDITGYEWYRPDTITVAEYFVVERLKDTMRIFVAYDGVTQEYLASDLTEEDVSDMLATGLVEQEPESVDVDGVHKYTMCGSRVLRDDGMIAGNRIPFVVAMAHRKVIDGMEYFEGHAQKAMDAQILKNIQLTTLGEIAASSPIRRPILTPEQIAGHAHIWDSGEDYPYRLLNPITDAQGNPTAVGPQAYLEPPSVPEALAALLQVSEADLQDILGNPMNAETLEPNQSGVAMELVQTRMDAQTSGYLDALAKAERSCAEIWLSMAGDVYVEVGRKIKTLSEVGKRGTAEIAKPLLNKTTGRIDRELDFSNAEYDVEVEVGPASASRRKATVRSIMSLMAVTTDPETLAMLLNIAVRNTEGEGMQSAREFARKRLVAMGVEEPTKEELAAAEETPAKPDPQAMLAESLALESRAKALKAEADAMLAKARTEETKAKTAATLAQIPIDQQSAAIEGVKAITQGMTPNAR